MLQVQGVGKQTTQVQSEGTCSPTHSIKHTWSLAAVLVGAIPFFGLVLL
jgi:hypothetical protein